MRRYAKLRLNLKLHFPTPSAVDQVDERVAIAVYNLSSCMAFGLSELDRLAGKALASLRNLLQPAVAMLRATGDNYRCGSAILAMGAVERARAGIDSEKLAESIETLQTARHLFSASANKQLAHLLYEGEAEYQLALAKIYAAQGHRDQESRGWRSQHKAALEQAGKHLENAKKKAVEQIKLNGLSLKSIELRQNLRTVSSRLYREMGRYLDALQEADEDSQE